ncbi:MAG TPA: STAS domain-containing protein, partial [Dongiaceae bacterium]
MTDQPGWIRLAQGRDGAVLQAGGAWTVEYVAELDRQVGALPKEAAPRALELGEIESIDTAGAWLLARATGQGERQEVPWQNLPAEFQPLAERVLTAGPKVIPDRPKERTITDWVAEVGAGVEAVGNE